MCTDKNPYTHAFTHTNKTITYPVSPELVRGGCNCTYT